MVEILTDLIMESKNYRALKKSQNPVLFPPQWKMLLFHSCLTNETDQIFVRNWNRIFASYPHGGIYE